MRINLKSLSIFWAALLLFTSGLFSNITFAQPNYLTVEFENTPLFSETNISPGVGVTKWVKVTNSASNTKTENLAVKAEEEGLGSNLDNVLDIEISKALDGSVLYKNTLTNFYSAGEVYLLSLGPAGATTLNFTVSINKEAGNEYQGKETSFDLSIGFTSISTPSPIPTSPTLFGGIFLRELGEAIGLTEGTPSLSPTPTETPKTTEEEVKGAEDEPTKAVVCPWWWITLILLSVFLGIFYYSNYKKADLKNWWVYPITLGILAYTIHLYAHQFYLPSKFCPWFWLLDTAVIVILTAIYWHYKNKKEQS